MSLSLGLGFGQKLGWEMGFVQNLGWEMGFIPPPPPLLRILKKERKIKSIAPNKFLGLALAIQCLFSFMQQMVSLELSSLS